VTYASWTEMLAALCPLEEPDRESFSPKTKKGDPGGRKARSRKGGGEPVKVDNLIKFVNQKGHPLKNFGDPVDIKRARGRRGERRNLAKHPFRK